MRGSLPQLPTRLHEWSLLQLHISHSVSGAVVIRGNLRKSQQGPGPFPERRGCEDLAAGSIGRLRDSVRPLKLPHSLEPQTGSEH
jgi:hypothetical protein